MAEVKLKVLSAPLAKGLVNYDLLILKKKKNPDNLKQI